MSNKHGLSRSIPEAIKREIRKQCGYGCVLCATSIYTYEHIDPLFIDATEHDPAKMALLCGSCHLLVTKGIYSKARIVEALKHPAAFKNGLSKFILDVNPLDDFIVRVGNTTFVNLETIIDIDGELILGLLGPEWPHSPPRLNAKFYDRNSVNIASIVNNEWQGSIDAFDIENVGNVLRIRSALYSIDLEIKINPPTEIQIDKLNLTCNEKRIFGTTSTGFTVTTKRAETFISPREARIERAPYWISLTDILRLGTDEVISCVSEGLIQRIPGVLIHEGVKTEYLESDQGRSLRSRPLRITATEPNGTLLFSIDTPENRLKKEYLEQSTKDVIDLVNEIEEYSGKEIIFRERKEIKEYSLASSTDEFNAIIHYHDKIIRPSAFAHAVLFIYESWVQQKPVLLPVSGMELDSFIADYIGSTLANLTIIPKLYEYGFRDVFDWNKSELDNWKKFRPSVLDVFTIRVRCLLGWVNTINLCDDRNTINKARTIIKRLGYLQKAIQLNHALDQHSSNREEKINCVIRYSKIPSQTGKLVWFNPKTETRVEKIVGYTKNY
jgi:hypothetical protein